MGQDFEPTYQFLNYCEREYASAIDENKRWQFFGVAKSRIEKMSELEKKAARHRVCNLVVNQRITQAKLDREDAKYLRAVSGDERAIPAINENTFWRETERELIAKWSEITVTHQAML